MVTVKDVSDYINTFAPYETQCEWDNCGLLIGDRDKEVNKIGFALDLTEETLDAAVKNNADLIITHHPVIFKAQKTYLKGNIAFDTALKGISVISAHTCYDCADGGVNEMQLQMIFAGAYLVGFVHHFHVIILGVVDVIPVDIKIISVRVEETTVLGGHINAQATVAHILYGRIDAFGAVACQ